VRKSLNRRYPISEPFATASSDTWKKTPSRTDGRKKCRERGQASSLHSRSKTVRGETFFLGRYFLRRKSTGAQTYYRIYHSSLNDFLIYHLYEQQMASSKHVSLQAKGGSHAFFNLRLNFKKSAHC